MEEWILYKRVSNAFPIPYNLLFWYCLLLMIWWCCFLVFFSILNLCTEMYLDVLMLSMLCKAMRSPNHYYSNARNCSDLRFFAKVGGIAFNYIALAIVRCTHIFVCTNAVVFTVSIVYTVHVYVVCFFFFNLLLLIAT